MLEKNKLYISLMDPSCTNNQDNISIEEVDKFLFSMPSEYALGHCVSRDMRMSAGIALYFKLLINHFCEQILTIIKVFNFCEINCYFRSIFGRVGELMDQKLTVGKVAYLQKNNRFIYYLISKERCFKKPTYSTLTAAITNLRDLIVKHEVKKLAIPRIGCGLDKLDWPRVKNIIKNLFQGVECMIKVCHFTQVCNSLYYEI